MKYICCLIEEDILLLKSGCCVLHVYQSIHYNSISLLRLYCRLVKYLNYLLWAVILARCRCKFVNKWSNFLLKSVFLCFFITKVNHKSMFRKYIKTYKGYAKLQKSKICNCFSFSLTNFSILGSAFLRVLAILFAGKYFLLTGSCKTLQ
jgi:hypothetical protein